MKLQKLHLLTFLGLALWAPQSSLNAKVPNSTLNTSWSSVVMGTVASFGTKSVKLPFKALNLCYQHYIITLAALGTGYWAYNKYFIPWNTERLAKIKQNCEVQANLVNAISANPVGFQSTIAENPQYVSNLQNVLNSNSITERLCSWIPTKIHSWLHDKWGLERGRSAHYFFEAAQQARNINLHWDDATEQLRDMSPSEPFSQQHLNILRLLSYSNKPHDTVSRAYLHRAGSALGKAAKKLFNQDRQANLPLAGAPNSN